MDTRQEQPGTDRWTTAGIGVVGVTAAAMSWAGWFLLAVMCGWPTWLAWMLPFAVDVYVITSARAWLRVPWVSRKTRRFAMVSTMFAVALSIAANAGYHWMKSLGWLRAPWLVVVTVSGLAPLMLALVAHLQARLNADRAAAEVAAPAPVATVPEPAPAPRVPDMAPAPGPDMPGPDVRAPAPARKPRKTATVDVDAEARALTALANNPDITAENLGIVIGRSERQAQRIRAKLRAQHPDISPGTAGPGKADTDPDMSGSRRADTSHDGA